MRRGCKAGNCCRHSVKDEPVVYLTSIVCSVIASATAFSLAAALAVVSALIVLAFTAFAFMEAGRLVDGDTMDRNWS